jgi:dUTP pyrophosphatase
MRIKNESKHPLPQYATSDSAGCDLRANIDEPVSIGPLQRVLIPTGLFIEIPHGFEGQIRPRSGLAFKHGITVLNAPGTIDADYRGEIKVLLINLSDALFTVNDGERIAQLVISNYKAAVWEQVSDLDDSERGAGGFGHTGLK